ncbi:MAG: hypothetical protein U1A78_37175 [Polyangia bacterium]
MSNTKSNEKNAAQNLSRKLTLNKEILGQSIADTDLAGVAGMSGDPQADRRVDRTMNGETNSGKTGGGGGGRLDQ